MISGSNKQLQQQLEYTKLKPDCHSWWISKMQSDIPGEWYSIKLCFKLGKNATGSGEMKYVCVSCQYFSPRARNFNLRLCFCFLGGSFFSVACICWKNIYKSCWGDSYFTWVCHSFHFLLFFFLNFMIVSFCYSSCSRSGEMCCPADNSFCSKVVRYLSFFFVVSVS